MNRALPLLPLLALAACGVEESGAQLLVPETIAVPWESSFNRTDDGIAVLVPFDIMVYDGTTGTPLDGVAIEVRGTSPGATVLPSNAISLVAPGPDALWDAGRDRYFEAAGAELVLHTDTDASGVCRAVLLVDAFPTDGVGELLPATVTVTMDGVEEYFLLVPE